MGKQGTRRTSVQYTGWEWCINSIQMSLLHMVTRYSLFLSWTSSRQAYYMWYKSAVAEICNTNGTFCHSRTEMVTMISKILFPLPQQLEVAVADGVRALAVNTSCCKRYALKLDNVGKYQLTLCKWHGWGWHGGSCFTNQPRGHLNFVDLVSSSVFPATLQASCWATALGANVCPK